MANTTVGECVREALSWGKRNNKPPEEVTERAADNLEEAGITAVSSERLLEAFEHQADEVGYDRSKYE